MYDSRVRFTDVDPVAIFDRDVPVDVQRSLLRNLMASYEDEHTEVTSKFPTELAKNVFGGRARTEAEHRLYGMGSRFPSVVAEIVPNATGSHHHVELRSDGIILTLSQTRTPNCMPHRAEYRHRLLASGAQSLFTPPDESGDPIFGILGYGTLNDRLAATPDFVRVLFPHPNRRDITASIDLLHRYGADGAASRPETDQGDDEKRLVAGKGRKSQKTG